MHQTVQFIFICLSDPTKTMHQTVQLIFICISDPTKTMHQTVQFIKYIPSSFVPDTAFFFPPSYYGTAKLSCISS